MNVPAPSVSPPSPVPPGPVAPPSPWPIALAGVAVAAAAVLAYHNSLGGPFVFDDGPTIVENPTIRHLGTALIPPHDSGITTSGRPVVNLTLALNYACGGLNPRGYHVVNLAIHALAGMTLFGLVRRTLLGPVLRARFATAALPIAFAVAVLWTTHPLQTAAVTYVVQRSEALVSLFFLLTLYAFARGGARWLGASLGACALGMATKEVMVSAPLVVLLYDRTFVAGTFRAAWRQRGRFYGALAATWLLLAWLMLGTGARGGTAGFGLGVAWWQYAFTQCGAIVHYLRLAFWPTPLVFDYGGAVLATGFTDVWPQALLLIALVAGTGWALVRRPTVGFLGACFFALLAPTSSVVPLADTMFEHRMYLPLATLVVAAVFALRPFAKNATPFLCGILALGLGWCTVRRNNDYRSELSLWRDTAAKRPGNVRAHYTLGSALAQAGQTAAAMSEYEIALRLNPDATQAHNNLGNLLAKAGRPADAAPHYEAALRIAPSADAHNNLANVLLRLGRARDARKHYEAALTLQPDSADAHNNLGNLLAQAGEFTEAARHYAAALKSRPDLADAHANLGNVLAQSGRLAEALPHYEAALRLRPDFADAHFNLATALTELRRWPEAIAHYQAVLRLQKNYPGARENLARTQAMQDVLGK